MATTDRRLAETLVLDELFDLSLYRRLHGMTSGKLHHMLGELIPIETRHVAFWQRHFGTDLGALDWRRRLKLGLITLACRLFGEAAIHLVLEAIEIYGVRKYLTLWRAHHGQPLGAAVQEVLQDELGHEDQVVSAAIERRIDPERVRNVFLGFNDGLVEILGAVSGFFAAFAEASSILVASATVAVAGAFSMGAGAFVAGSSEREVQRVEAGKRAFLGETGAAEGEGGSALPGALIVAVSYLAGAFVPVLPVLLGSRSLWWSLAAGLLATAVVSTILSFLSGMNLRRRLGLNAGILAAAVAVTYAIGLLTRALFGIAVE